MDSKIPPPNLQPPEVLDCCRQQTSPYTFNFLYCCNKTMISVLTCISGKEFIVIVFRSRRIPIQQVCASSSARTNMEGFFSSSQCQFRVRPSSNSCKCLSCFVILLFWVKNCAHAVCFSSFFFTFFFFSFFCNGSWHHLMLMFQILWFNTQISRVYHHRIQCFLSNSELGFSNCQLKFVPN